MPDPADTAKQEPVSRQERLAADWCRAWGEDHGLWVRRVLEAAIAAELGHSVEVDDDATD